jgi:hypothetical protein
MLGAIRDGDTVRLVAPTPHIIRKGAVVMAVLPDDRLALHRVTKVDVRGVSLRGDSCRRGDGYVAIESVVAVAQPTPRRTPRSYLYRIVFAALRPTT